jgi:F-type H+-transporting ATPase subunit delta
MSDVALWWIALGAGLVVAVVAVVLLQTFLNQVRRIEANAAQIWQAGKEVAEVRSAVELTADQQDRLAKALNAATGKQVTIKVIVDPSVLGGIVAQVGDTVIDGSVRSRLEQLRNAF